MNSAESTETNISLGTTPLFRAQVTAGQNARWLGNIKLSQPISITLISACALVLAAMIISYAAVADVTRKARVSGLIMPTGGTITVDASSSGIVLKTFIRENQLVTEGAAMFELSTEKQSLGGEINSLIAQQLRSRLETLVSESRARVNEANEKKSSIAAKLLNSETETTQLEKEIILTQRRIQLAKKSVMKFDTLENSGFVSNAQTQQKQEDLLDYEVRLSSLLRAQVQLAASQIELTAQQKQNTTNLESALAQIALSKASLEQELLENRGRTSVILVAPKSGHVTTITSRSGQAIAAGQPLATIIPTMENESGTDPGFEAQLFAPSRTAGFIAIGSDVLIRYHAYPYQKFGLYRGKVSDVSGTPLAPSELPANFAGTILSNAGESAAGAGGKEGLYRIKVKLAEQSVSVYGKSQALRPGMTVEADILQEKRKIWEWIAEPILAVAKR